MFKKTSTGGGIAGTCTPDEMLSSCGCLPKGPVGPLEGPFWDVKWVPLPGHRILSALTAVMGLVLGTVI